MADPLHEKGKVLEDLFFAERDRELIERLRRKAAAEQAALDLSALTGISDQALLAHIVSLGVTPETLAALSLVPLLWVGWADHVLDHAERDAILVEAAAAGVLPGTAAHELLSGWLTRDPNEALVEAWKSWYAALAPHLSAEDRANLKRDLLEKAQRVARASGGVFKLGAVSSAEKSALEALEAVLSA